MYKRESRKIMCFREFNFFTFLGIITKIIFVTKLFFIFVMTNVLVYPWPNLTFITLFIYISVVKDMHINNESSLQNVKRYSRAHIVVHQTLPTLLAHKTQPLLFPLKVSLFSYSCCHEWNI